MLVYDLTIVDVYHMGIILVFACLASSPLQHIAIYVCQFPWPMSGLHFGLQFRPCEENL